MSVVIHNFRQDEPLVSVNGFTVGYFQKSGVSSWVFWPSGDFPIELDDLASIAAKLRELNKGAKTE